jgi:photosystem II stability/assembly factor-like uncharacterized protein
MNRRDFLKSMTVGLSAVVLPTAFTRAPVKAATAQVPASAAKRKLIGTTDGRILESLDGGRTWHQVANFGSQYSVRKVSEGQRQVVAQIGFQGRGFMLKSADARTWFTA